MVNIYLNAYMNYNLGDDLFVKIISERYNYCTFHVIAQKSYKSLGIRNLNIHSELYNKAIRKLSRKKYSSEKYLQKKSDVTILLGGSMFMQTSNDNEVVHNHFYEKPYFIIGSNFGPFHDERFRVNYTEFYKNVDDVCFRDNKSYDLFSSLKNVRFAPDVVFSMPLVPQQETHKTVVFSVINCEEKSNQIGGNYQSNYIAKIVEMIHRFKSLDYKVVLMSFCKAEGDEKCIEMILTKLPSKNFVSTHFYRNDIDKAIEVLNSSKVIVGTRFHANVLGMVLKKTVIPISYNVKTVNLLKDIHFSGKYIELKNIHKFDVNSITESDLEYRCDVTESVKNSEQQFKILDKFLKGNLSYE